MHALLCILKPCWLLYFETFRLYFKRMITIYIYCSSNKICYNLIPSFSVVCVSVVAQLYHMNSNFENRR